MHNGVQIGRYASEDYQRHTIPRFRYSIFR
jgi:hypothetical protein